MFCTNCGAKLNDNSKFCHICGSAVILPEAPSDSPISRDNHEDQEQPTVQIPENIEESEPKSEPESEVTIDDGNSKKINKKWIALFIIAGILIAGGVFTFFLGRNMQMRTIEEHVELADSYYDNNEFEKALAEYDKLSLAKSPLAEEYYDEFTDGYRNCKRMIDAIEEFNEINAKVGDESKYIKTYPSLDFDAKKENVQTAIEKRKAQELKDLLEEYSNEADKLISLNRENAQKAIDSMKNKYNQFSSDSFEYYILSSNANNAEELMNNADYVGIQECVDSFEASLSNFSMVGNASYLISAFSQADVSESGIVKMYFATEGQSLFLTNFQIYEALKGTGDWMPCTIKEMKQVQGNLTIDLVADISTSMYHDFGTMQSALSGFAASTDPDTTLGLSLISSVYSRVLDFTTDKNIVQNKIWELPCEGCTSLYQSLYSSVMYTASSTGPRCVIAFTDGRNEPYDVGYDVFADDVIEASQLYNVPVYIIGIGSYVESSELIRIAQSTGGEYYNISQVYDLRDIYNTIYNQQQLQWEVTYETTIPNTDNRKVYVLYYDENTSLGINIEEEIQASALTQMYNMANSISTDNLESFYNEDGYISADEFARITDIEQLQTIINIYFARNGFMFGEGDVLQKMLSMGVISQNGTLESDTVIEIMKTKPILWANYSAAFNRRFEIVYDVASTVYYEYGGNITYNEMKQVVSQRLGESKTYRYSLDISKAYEKLTAQ